MDSKPTRTIQKQVDELDAANQCLMCKKQCEPGGQPPDGRNRGLCLGKGGCYHRYAGRRSKLTDEQQAEYDAKLLRLGMILESRQGQRPDSKTVFDEVADEVKS